MLLAGDAQANPDNKSTHHAACSVQGMGLTDATATAAHTHTTVTCSAHLVARAAWDTAAATTRKDEAHAVAT